MQTFPSREAKNRFGEVLGLAAREPVSITRNGEEVAIIMSPEQYEANHKAAVKKTLDLMEDLRAEVIASGATEEEIEALIAEDA